MEILWDFLKISVSEHDNIDSMDLKSLYVKEYGVRGEGMQRLKIVPRNLWKKTTTNPGNTRKNHGMSLRKSGNPVSSSGIMLIF